MVVSCARSLLRTMAPILSPPSAIGLDLVERQRVDVDQSVADVLDIKLHQVDQRGPAGNETCCAGTPRCSSALGIRCRFCDNESLHRCSPAPSTESALARLLHGGDDVGIRAATADIAAHAFATESSSF